MAVAPAAWIDAPARMPLPYGLFSVVAFTEGAGRWANGAEWDAGTCAPARGIGDPSCDPEDETEGLPKNLTYDPSTGSASPFTVYGVWACSPVGTTPAQAEEKARQHLLAREEARVEQALWTGDLGNTPNLDALAGTPPTAASLAAGVGLVEATLAAGYGSAGVLHMSRALASELLTAGGAETSGGRLRTKLGTPIVAGSGYPVADRRVIGTAPVFGYRSEVFAPSATPGDLFDPRRNDLYAVAERTYLLGFDTCGVAAATIP